MSQSHENVSLGVDLSLKVLAGSAGGLVSDSIVHPIDSIRTNLQVQKATSPTQYRGMWDAYKQIGIRSLYRGFGIVAAASVPAHALYFGGYEACKAVMQRTRGEEEKSMYVHFVSGLAADVAGSLVWTPQDVVKQRLQLQSSKVVGQPYYANSWSACRTIWVEEGARGFFKGYWAGLLTYGPFVAVHFTAYEAVKRWSNMYFQRKHTRDLPAAVHLIGGAFAGGVAAGVTNPLDVVKTRLQVETTIAAKAGTAYRGIGDALMRMWREEGVRVFSQGLHARVSWICPATAITMAAYEYFKVALDSAFVGRIDEELE